MTMAVKEENKGARKTQTLRMSMVTWKKCRTWYRTAEVIISPGEREEREPYTTLELLCVLYKSNPVYKPTLIYLYCSLIITSDSNLDKWCHQ